MKKFFMGIAMIVCAMAMFALVGCGSAESSTQVYENAYVFSFDEETGTTVAYDREGEARKQLTTKIVEFEEQEVAATGNVSSEYLAELAYNSQSNNW